MTDDESELLRKAMRGVTPLHRPKPVRAPAQSRAAVPQPRPPDPPPAPEVAPAPPPPVEAVPPPPAPRAEAAPTPAPSPPPAAVTLRRLMEARGLIDEAEIHAALRALSADAELVDRLVVSDVAFVTRHLAERLFLGSALDEVPAGALLVRVPPERSEGSWSPAAREAMSKFSTACLVRGWRRVTFVGAPERWHRVLGGGLDRRLAVSFAAVGDPVHGDAVVAVGCEVAGAIAAPASSLAGMLTSAAEAIARG